MAHGHHAHGVRFGEGVQGDEVAAESREKETREREREEEEEEERKKERKKEEKERGGRSQEDKDIDAVSAEDGLVNKQGRFSHSCVAFAAYCEEIMDMH